MKAAPSGFGLVASVALHGVIAALLILWPAPEELSGDQTEAQGVAVIYEGAPEVGMVESPAAPPEVAAVPPAAEVPPPPPPMPPPPAVAAAPPPPPPLPVDLAEVMLPPPPPPAPVAEPPPELAEKPPEPPREVAEAPPERRPPPQQSARQTAAPQPVRLNAALQGMESFTLEGRTTPPEAVDAARNRRPNYPEASRRRGEQGVVRVELLVDPNGRVADVRILESSGFGTLDAAAVQAVRDWRFRPAQRAGVPVAGSITTAVHFRLETARR
ncbi:MAG: energy transducer TonB [Roseomonas sp.]|nr:energy transducer TonB [Roseomonas sp.]MCA3298217.1 energy transducer TonB [Roseomonas sp.]